MAHKSISCLNPDKESADGKRPKIQNLQYDPEHIYEYTLLNSVTSITKQFVDMFDCVIPTRSGRTGLAFTWNGRINIKNSKNRENLNG